MKKAVLAFLIALFIVLTIPVKALGRTFPEPQGFVNDFASMFSTEFQQSLENQLVKLEEETTIELSVATIISLEDDVIENVAVELFEQWSIGKKDEDNGLLLLIAKDDHKIRIEVGYGLEPIVTDAAAGRIIRDQMTPAFKKENYEQGTLAAINELNGLVKGDIVYDEPVVNESSNDSGIIAISFMVFWFLLIYTAAFLSRSKSYHTGGIVGGLAGLLVKLISGGSILSIIIFALIGLFFDWLFSKNYKSLKKAGKSTSWRSSWGGFSSKGSSSGSSFGGFSGGSSGGGGASGGW